MALSFIFHMVFAALGIGLPFLMVLVERQYLRTGQLHYLQLAKKWAKATGLLFAIGAVSGTALAFELGLLWPRYMEIAGPAVGHAFALEAFAFFVEAIFIALYVYGWDRLGRAAHWWCGVVIAVSGAASGILVLAVNAWMQQPVGFVLDAVGRVISTDPFAIFRSYTWYVMWVHSTLACYVAVSFGVAAYYAVTWLRGQRDAYQRSAIVVCLAVGGVGAFLQPISGDFLARFVYRTQPAKFAAMEGNFVTRSHAPMHLGGYPDTAERRMRFAIPIPDGLSLLAAHDPDAIVVGLNEIPDDLWPSVPLTHFAFEVMIAIGTLLMLLSAWFFWRWWRFRDRVLESRRLCRAVAICGPLGFVALEFGWVTTEVGRQPWIVHHVLRTTNAVTPSRAVTPVFFSFVLLYLLLAGTLILLLRYLGRMAPQALAREHFNR